jgi:hypothetical protein
MASYEPTHYPTGGLPPDPVGAGQPVTVLTEELPAADESFSQEPSATEKAAQSAKAGQQAASDLAQTAVDKAQEVAGEAKQQARELFDEAREQLREHAGDQHRNAVSNLRSLAQELDSMARSSQSGGVASGLVSQAADRTHGMAAWLEDRQPGDLVDELRRFARRRPGAFLTGAVVAGVLAGRLTRGAVAVHSDAHASSGATDRSDSVTPATAAPEGLLGSHRESEQTSALPRLGTGQTTVPEVMQ